MITTTVHGKPYVNPLKLAHCEMIAALVPLTAHRIIGQADLADVEEREEHVKEVTKVFAAYLEKVIGDTADNLPIGTITPSRLKDAIAGFQDAVTELTSLLYRAGIDLEHAA